MLENIPSWELWVLMVEGRQLSFAELEDHCGRTGKSYSQTGGGCFLCRARAMEETLEVESEARVPEAVTCLYLCPFVRFDHLS